MKIIFGILAATAIMSHVHFNVPKCYDPNTNTPISCSQLQTQNDFDPHTLSN